MPRRILRSYLVAALLATTACAGVGLWTDLTSVSTGSSNAGVLRKPAKLPLEGPGFVVPTRWAERGFNHGVDELVVAVQRAAQVVSKTEPRATLGIADLSRDRGGSSSWHRSHHSGRDVDLLFYTTDTRGRPLPPPARDMMHFDGEGKPVAPRRSRDAYVENNWQRRRFDTARNWALIEALLRDTTIRVQWIFVSDPLKQKLLTHARLEQRPSWLIDYADMVLRQPQGVPPHDDHFHVRVYCSRADRFHGCQDTGVIWQHEKKAYKYGGPERYDPLLWRVALRPLRGLY